MPAKIKIDAGRLAKMMGQLRFYGLNIGEQKESNEPLFDSFIGYAKKDQIVVFQGDSTSPTVLHKAFIKKVTVVDEGLVWCAALDKLKEYASAFSGEIEVTFDSSIVLVQGKHRKSFANVVIEECDAATIAKKKFDSLIVEGKEVKDTKGHIWDLIIDTSVDEIKKIVDDVQLIGGNFFPLTVKMEEGSPVLIISAKNSTDSSERPIESTLSGFVEDFRAEFSYGFDPVFSNLRGKIEMRLCKDCPLLIVKMEDENEFHRFVVAQKVEEKPIETESAAETAIVKGVDGDDREKEEVTYEELKEGSDDEDE